MTSKLVKFPILHCGQPESSCK